MLRSIGRLLYLQTDDLESAGLDENFIDLEVIGEGVYSYLDLIKFSVIKLFLGLYKMLLAPVFTSYLDLFSSDFSKDFYFGLDRKIVLILDALIYNLYIFPMFFSKLYKKIISNNRTQDILVNTIVILYFLIVFLYSVKFVGVRSFKIDFITHFLMLLFISSYKAKIDRRFYIILVLLMLAVNLYVLL